MTETLIKGLHYKTGQAIEVRMKDGKISRIAPLEEHTDVGETLIAPGLVDLQINGYNGLDFNTLPIPGGLVSEFTHAVLREGVTSFYPTVITNSSEEIEEAMRSIAEQVRQDRLAQSVIRGIHLEGPFISAEDGPRGAHGKPFVQAPDWDMFSRWQDASDGNIRILTLSPEWPGSADFITKCTASGVKVSIGHTAATPEQIQEAVAAGASLSTHFGNGAHLMLPRHPNYLWEQLAQDELWTCLIGDGFHLPDSVLKVAMAVKQEKAILVSDAVYLAGMPPGEYKTHIGGNVVLTEAGKLHLAENSKLLAGSAQMLLWGIDHLIDAGLADLASAWEMASERPAKLMELDEAAGLTEEAPADLICFSRSNGKLTVAQTYKAGELVFQA